LNSTYAAAFVRYSWLLMVLGRFEEALEQIARAEVITRDVDPHRLVVIHATRASAYYFSRDYAQAIDECRKGLALDDGYFMLHVTLGRAAARSQNPIRALAAFEKAKAASPGHPLVLVALGYAAAVSGRQTEAPQIFQSLDALSRQRYVPATYFGMLSAARGDTDQAFTWLEKASRAG